MIEKYGVLKEIELAGIHFYVPLNATEEEILKEASKHGIEMEKISSWKEVADGGEESSHLRSKRYDGAS